MNISFFSTSQEPILGADYSTHPDCIAVFNIEYDPTTQIATLVDGEVVITDRPTPPESPSEKHSRIYQSLITAETLDDLDLEGEIFSDFEIGEMITARVFGGNPHAQMAFMAKIQAMTLSGIPNPELIIKAQEIEVKINEVRNLFNLGNL